MVIVIPMKVTATFDEYTILSANGNKIVEAGNINRSMLEKFSIKQTVFYLNINWEALVSSLKMKKFLLKKFLNILMYSGIYQLL